MTICDVCGIPFDAGFFDVSTIQVAPNVGDETLLARYELPREYCGILLYFAQFTDAFAADPLRIRTPGYQWQIRCSGQPRDPYLAFDHILNPWGQNSLPVHLRLEEGCLLEFAIRNISAPTPDDLKEVGGRLLGRYWYNPIYGGAPNPL
jgi:hypothetical protein